MKMLQKLRKLPIFGRQKLVLAFEYGTVLAHTAHIHNVELTPELIAKAEEMILNEFTNGNPTRIAVDMIPNIMSIFELDLSK